MKSNPIRQLEGLGQGIWLDYIRRAFIASGRLRGLIRDDGISGMTSNPAIFQKAIAEGNDYASDIRTMSHKGFTPSAIYDALSLRDVQMAADEFRPVFERTSGKDGFVSLEVNPHLAHETLDTIEEARRLWKALNRPNVFIKVPATDEGIIAVKQLTVEGINVNVTLLFGLKRYKQAAEAFITGLEERSLNGKPVDHVASVASFFLSRIDSMIDPMLEEIISHGGRNTSLAASITGQTAIAGAKMAYRIYKVLFNDIRFKKLAEKGANVQRLVWASTGTKNPEYSDVKYIDALIGRDTVNTVPIDALNAYRDHGNPKPRLELDAGTASETLENLSKAGIDMDKAAEKLEKEGIEKFIEPFDKMMESLFETPVEEKS
jgi:transaldolase